MLRDGSTPTVRRPRNDPAQYDDLLDEWWAPRGAFAMLHWIAAARARLVPPATHPAAVLVDIACGGGLMGPYVGSLGYRHVGLDLAAPGRRPRHHPNAGRRPSAAPSGRER